jgi:lysyl-tRNA synthetase, class II
MTGRAALAAVAVMGLLVAGARAALGHLRVFAGTLRGVADQNMPQQVRIRLGKRQRLLDFGADPYPVSFARTASAAGLRARYGDLPPDMSTGEVASVAGRVMLSRIGGKLCFARLRDDTSDIQVMVSLAGVGDERLAAWKRDVDLGDHVGVAGEVVTSRSGELSVLASSWMLTAKSLRPLPEKFRGLTDAESRVRQRYVDLIVNPQARRSRPSAPPSSGGPTGRSMTSAGTGPR